jgi:hypothetical protein
LPALIKYYGAHRSDRFEIVAFHDARARDFAELEQKLAEKKIRQTYWSGNDLPFPVLLDATGETIRQFGVQAFPTTILIDPEGRLVGQGDEKLLEQALKGELPPPRAANQRR